MINKKLWSSSQKVVIRDVNNENPPLDKTLLLVATCHQFASYTIRDHCVDVVDGRSTAKRHSPGDTQGHQHNFF
jgi:hypothetical protein